MKPRVKNDLRKPEEDFILKTYIETHAEGNWTTVSAKSSMMRGGKNCRLRWKNYLRPNIKRGGMSREEEDLIIRMHKLLGNRWSLIAGRLPGRTDSEVKNYWNTHLNKKCHPSKRKTIDSNNHHNGNDGNINNNNINKRQHKSLSICKANPKIILDELDGTKNDEEIIVTNTWIQDALSKNYYIESPVIPSNNDSFAFSDEPFIANLDSFDLFEAFSYSSEQTYRQMNL